MREDNKTFTKCLVLFANFIRYLKQNPSNMRRVAELGSTGQGGGRGRDAGGRGGGGRGRGGRVGRGSPSTGGPPDQAEVDKVTWLQANKYYSTKEYKSSLWPRRRGSTSTARRPQLPSAKLLLCRAAMIKLPGNQMTTVTSLMTTTMGAFRPSAPLGQT